MLADATTKMVTTFEGFFLLLLAAAVLVIAWAVSSVLIYLLRWWQSRGFPLPRLNRQARTLSPRAGAVRRSAPPVREAHADPTRWLREPRAHFEAREPQARTRPLPADPLLKRFG